MGGLINLIKKLFSGILSFIGGILGGKKGGYYLELDESEAGKPAATAKAATEAPAAKAEPAKPAKAAKAKPAPAKVETASLNGTSSSVNSVISNGATPSAPASNNGAAPQPTSASLAAASAVLSTPRRRPGANMNSYLEMAKQVKTPG